MRLQCAKKYAIIVLGASILAFGIYNVHSQGIVTEGGILGMNLLLKHWFGITPAVSEFVMDCICYLIGFYFLGKSFAKYSIIATCCFSLVYAVLERFPRVVPDLTQWPLVAAVAGALFVGTGVGLVVRIGGAAGGDDALAMVISKVARWPIARAYLFTDLVVLSLSLTYIPLRSIAYSLVTVTLSSCLIGFVQKAGKREPPSPAGQTE